MYAENSIVTEETLANGKKSTRWTADEDERLKSAVAKHGTKSWTLLASLVQTKTSHQCHQHWTRVLDPRISRSEWSEDEYALLLKRVEVFGDKAWKKVADGLQGRTDIQCRQRWLTLRNARFGEWRETLLERGKHMDVPDAGNLSKNSASYSSASSAAAAASSSSSSRGVKDEDDDEEEADEEEEEVVEKKPVAQVRRLTGRATRSSTREENKKAAIASPQVKPAPSPAPSLSSSSSSASSSSPSGPSPAEIAKWKASQESFQQHYHIPPSSVAQSSSSSAPSSSAPLQPSSGPQTSFSVTSDLPQIMEFQRNAARLMTQAGSSLYMNPMAQADPELREQMFLQQQILYQMKHLEHVQNKYLQRIHERAIDKQQRYGSIMSEVSQYTRLPLDASMPQYPLPSSVQPHQIASYYGLAPVAYGNGPDMPLVPPPLQQQQQQQQQQQPQQPPPPQPKRQQPAPGQVFVRPAPGRRTRPRNPNSALAKASVYDPGVEGPSSPSSDGFSVVESDSEFESEVSESDDLSSVGSGQISKESSNLSLARDMAATALASPSHSDGDLVRSNSSRLDSEPNRGNVVRRFSLIEVQVDDSADDSSNVPSPMASAAGGSHSQNGPTGPAFNRNNKFMVNSIMRTDFPNGFLPQPALSFFPSNHSASYSAAPSSQSDEHQSSSVPASSSSDSQPQQQQSQPQQLPSASSVSSSANPFSSSIQFSNSRRFSLMDNSFFDMDAFNPSRNNSFSFSGGSLPSLPSLFSMDDPSSRNNSLSFNFGNYMPPSGSIDLSADKRASLLSTCTADLNGNNGSIFVPPAAAPPSSALPSLSSSLNSEDSSSLSSAAAKRRFSYLSSPSDAVQLSHSLYLSADPSSSSSSPPMFSSADDASSSAASSSAKPNRVSRRDSVTSDFSSWTFPSVSSSSSSSSSVSAASSASPSSAPSSASSSDPSLLPPPPKIVPLEPPPLLDSQHFSGAISPPRQDSAPMLPFAQYAAEVAGGARSSKRGRNMSSSYSLAEIVDNGNGNFKRNRQSSLMMQGGRTVLVSSEEIPIEEWIQQHSFLQ